MDADDIRRLELRRFLKARRGAVSRESKIGERRRRRAGMRIEEVCALADISVSWYGSLEQGKPISVAPRTLDRIADALRLEKHDRDYLFALALPPADREPPPATFPIRAILDGFAAGPAMLVDHRLTVIDFNAPAARLYGFTPEPELPINSIPWRVFTDADRLRFYANWREHAQRVAGILRRNAARHIADTELHALVDALRGESAEFCELWERVEVRGAAPLRKVLHVPPVGTFSLDIVLLPIPESSNVVIFQTPATLHDAACLRALDVVALAVTTPA